MRALVRALDERAEDLRRLGAKIAVGDDANYASLLAALENVESAYFCYPTEKRVSLGLLLTRALQDCAWSRSSKCDGLSHARTI